MRQPRPLRAPMRACVSPLAQWRESQRETNRFNLQVFQKYRGMSPACVPRDYGLAGASVRNDKSGWFGEFIGCDLERVAVGIAKINGVRNLVILKFEFDSAFFEFALRC